MTTTKDSDIRPSRRWYHIAIAIVLLGVLTGAAVGIPYLLAFFNAFPTLDDPFRSRQPTTVELRGGHPAVIYVSPDTAGGGVSCTSGADITVMPVTYTFTFFSDWQSWAAAYEVTAAENGTYDVTCTDTVGDAVFAVGDDRPDNASLLRKLAAALIFGLVLPCVALAAGGILFAAVLRRRSAALSGARSGFVPG